MSIVSIKDTSISDLTLNDVERLGEKLGITFTNEQDKIDYLLLLKSFEAVMINVHQAPDYLHPTLDCDPLVGDRQYWKPTYEENPLNAWSHCCSLRCTNPTSRQLEGCTVAIKDNIAVGGLPTTMGSVPSMFPNGITFPLSKIDATVVSRILEAGAEIKGTSSCEAFCTSPLSYTTATGPVQNPLLHGYTAGGSSSGSAALVAAHVLDRNQGSSRGCTAEVAIGTDQAGSVRIPASFNGIYGLKPTFGLVPYTGAAIMSPMIDHLGLLAPSLEHIAAMLEIMAGYDGIDPRMSPESPLLSQVKPYSQLLANFREKLSAPSKETPPLRVGLLSESFDIPGIAPEVRNTVLHAANQFFRTAGAIIVDVSIPMHLNGAVLWTASTRPSMYNWLCKGKTSGQLNYLPPHIEPQWPPTQDTYDALNSANPALLNIILSGMLSDTKSLAGLEAKAHRKVYELRAAYDQAFADVDVLVTPCAPTIAMPHPKVFDDSGNECSILDKLSTAIGLTNNTSPFNVTGHPALSVPCGFSSRSEHPEVQLPIGMQLIGRRWEDEQVILAAALFEKGRELEYSLVNRGFHTSLNKHC